MEHKGELGSYTAYILIQNVELKSSKLLFDKFSIRRIDNSNWEQLKDIFKLNAVKKVGQCFIERRYDKLARPPKDSIDDSGLGRIPYDSEDLMVLMRLFKGGDIVFVAQAFRTPISDTLSQYPYPRAFSSYRSSFHYKMSEVEIPLFNEFFKEVRKWPGWNSSWFKIARRYFLWGGSKEFRPGRDNERILDYMIALEASYVFEMDFVSRRLRERTAGILGGTEKEQSGFRKRINDFYGIRSTLSHGSPLSSRQVGIIKKESLLFEQDVRQLLKSILRNCLSDENKRREHPRELYDISDHERAKNDNLGFPSDQGHENQARTSGKIETEMLKDYL